MAHNNQSEDEPLPATLAFVMAMGVVFFLGWIAMFVLLKVRF